MLPFVALAGAIVMTLPQALAFTLAPARERGRGRRAARLLARRRRRARADRRRRCAIELFHGSLSATDGYAAMWPVVGIPVLLTLPLLRALERKGEPALGPTA